MVWTYVCHEFPVGLQDFERHAQDFVDEFPELASGALGEGDVGQVAEDVVELAAFFDVLFDGFDAVAYDYLNKKN